MTSAERELMLKIRTQQTLGNGLFMRDTEFKEWACQTYGITEAKLTQLQKELLSS